MRFYVQAVGRRWRWLVAVTTVFTFVGIGVGLALPTTYSAGVTIYVSTQAGTSADSAYQSVLVSQQRVKSYTDLVTSPRIMTQVVEQLQLPLTPVQLSDKVSASSSQDSVLIDVTATDANANRAAEIANAVSLSFAGLVTELERPTTRSGSSPVVARPVSPAVAPAVPSSVSLPTVVGATAFFGLLLGVAAAVLRDTTDQKVRSAADLEEATESPTLGVVRRSESVSRAYDDINLIGEAGHLEDLRRVRVNLQYIDVDRKPTVLGLTSSLPAEGKTTVTLGLAKALALAGERVLVIDCDLRRPRVADATSLSQDVGLTTVLAGRCPLDAAVQTADGYDVLSSGQVPPNPGELLGSGNARRLLANCKANYDRVLIDTAPLLPVADTSSLAPSLDGVVLLAKWGSTSPGDLTQARELLTSVSARMLGTILTVAPGESSKSKRSYDSYLEPRRDVQPLRASAASTPGQRPRHASPTPSPTPRPHVHTDENDNQTTTTEISRDVYQRP